MNRKTELCYGVIPLRRHAEQWQVLLIQHRKGLYWAFPKGHGEPGETPQQAAERELKEETGLSVQRWLAPEPLKESYSFTRSGHSVDKQVIYYLAEVTGEVAIQTSEIVASRWIALSDALSLITFPQSRSVCETAIMICTSL